MKYVIPLIILTIFLVYFTSGPDTSDFAQCLTDNGAKMFGAYWCGHCKEQKELFGDGFKNIKYIECSLPGGDGQTELCKKENIEGYPLWEFKDGSRESGQLPLETLSEKTGCPLP